MKYFIEILALGCFLSTVNLNRFFWSLIQKDFLNHSESVNHRWKEYFMEVATVEI